MLTLVRKARNRWLRNELLAQGANAVSGALAAVILLLLLGTQILDWGWAACIPLAALAVGAFLVRRRLPSPYAVAQSVDRRLGLSDTISTALYFHEHPGAPGEAQIRELQLERANRMAADADVRRAIPYTVPRAVYPMAALLLVASSLFALRYGLTRRLDLAPPLARILQQNFGFEDHPQVARNSRKPLAPQQTDPADDSIASPDPQNMQGADQPSDDPENASQTAGEQKDGKGQKKTAEDGKPQNGDDGDKAEGQDQDQSGDQKSAGDQQAGNDQQGKGEQKQDANGKDSNGSSDNSSLLSKMKDAVQNLLSKVKPQQGQGAQQQNGQNQNSKQAPKGQQDGKQQASKNGEKQNGGSQQGDAQEGQSADQAQDSQDPQSKGSGKSDAQQASKQPGSGIGSQDGDKSIKQAEQLAAMGKISEIFGKRSANISGEATVEVQSTAQQLKTAYVQRGAQHTQGGAEINRDEVPVALQSYVEQYFELSRKQGQAAAPVKPVVQK